MDILGEYEKQRPVASTPIRQTTFGSEQEYGFFIRLVIRLSGGKIQNARQASMVLLAVAAAILLTSILIFARVGGFFSSSKSVGVPIPVAGPEDARFNTQPQP